MCPVAIEPHKSGGRGAGEGGRLLCFDRIWMMPEATRNTACWERSVAVLSRAVIHVPTQHLANLRAALRAGGLWRCNGAFRNGI